MEYRSFTACLPAPGSKCFIVDDGAVRKAEVTMLSARFKFDALLLQQFDDVPF